MNFFDKKSGMIVSGLIFGIIAAVLAATGNPGNMAICAACFIRDIAGAMELHTAETVQYFRPEIVGFIAGAFVIALVTKEFRPTTCSSPFIRFILGFIMMVGSLVFLGCPLRMILRLAGGDLNAVVGLFGFIAGIATGIFFLKKGFNLGRSAKASMASGLSFPIIVILAFVVSLLGYFAVSTSGPGSLQAPIALALAGGLIIGALIQKSRLCMAGGFRDLILIKDASIFLQIAGIFVVMLVYNLATGNFTLGFADQPIAHTDHLWNFLGLYAVGFAAILASGCPLRQMILAGQGSGDGVVTFLGLLVGAAFCHNFGWASSTAGATANGQIALVVCIVGLFAIAFSVILGKRR